MKLKAKKLIAIGIVLAEIASLGIATMTPASAQSAAQERRQIRRQQQLILQQQRQIQENQRRLQAQQQQLAQPRGAYAADPTDANRDLPRGLLGNVGGCPIGYTYSLFYGCLPHVIVN